MNARRRMAASLAAVSLMGAGAVRASAFPAEDACNDSPDGGYTLCLLLTDSGENYRSNYIVNSRSNPDPDTGDDEGNLYADVYQYEYGGYGGEQLSDYLVEGYGTGAYVLLYNLLDQNSVLEFDAEHGGYNGYSEESYWTYAYLTYFDIYGGHTDVHADIENSYDFDGDSGWMEVGARHTDNQGGRHFVGVEADNDSCTLHHDQMSAACPVNLGVPGNPGPIPFLPIP